MCADWDLLPRITYRSSNSSDSVPGITYRPSNSNDTAELAVPPGILAIQGAYNCSDCNICHWDNITKYFQDKHPWLNVTSWATFVPFKNAGHGCFTEAPGNLYTRRYTGKLTMHVHTGRPMQRMVKALLDIFGNITGISPWFDPTPLDNPEPWVLRALDVQAFSVVTTSEEIPSNGTFHYVVVEKGSPDWRLLEQVYPDMSQECKAMKKDVKACTSSSACCGTWNTNSNSPETSCLNFTSLGECLNYTARDFEISPNDTCVDYGCTGEPVPHYAYKKVYMYGQLDNSNLSPLDKRWKEAEKPWNNMLFKDVLNLPALEEPNYARGVCTNTYTGYLNTTEGKIYSVDCGYKACWLTGKFNNVTDPPNTTPSELRPKSMQPELTCTEVQSASAWAISNVGSILAAMSGVAFVGMLLYVSANLALQVYTPAEQQQLQQQESTMGRWLNESPSGPLDGDTQQQHADEARNKDVGGVSVMRRPLSEV